MKIAMLTNTYAPHVGGVARSVHAFAEEFRRRGHEVLVVCPQFEGAPAGEAGVLRVPALQNFNGSDFSVVLTVPRSLRTAIEDFGPDILHSHHPFLLGSTAVRLARALDRPLVFTHHTMYEQYTHYVPGDSQAMRRFVIHLSTNYANLSDEVFAPSESIAEILRKRAVRVPIRVVPTGVRLADYAAGCGSGSGFRRIMGIPEDAFVIGHVGRLAAEKNLGFLGAALAGALAAMPSAHALLVGQGPEGDTLRAAFAAAGVSGRAHFAGLLQHRFLVSAYKAMDVFAFASRSETQGMVVSEAMAAGVPVVALDAPGVREVVRDGVNGRLLPEDAPAAAFAAAVGAIFTGNRAALRAAARSTAEGLSLERSADLALAAYRELLGGRTSHPREAADEAWSRTLRSLRTEWDLLSGMADAAVARDTEEDGTPA